MSDLSGKSIKIICDSLENNSNVKTFDISGCKIDVEGIFSLSRVLNLNHSLTEIDISSTKLVSSSFKVICDSLLSNNSLIKMNISSNYIDDGCVYDLGNFFKCNKKLERIDLSQNRFTNTGAFHIASTLGQNNSLTFLNLSNSFLNNNNTHVQDINCILKKNLELKNVKEFTIFIFNFLLCLKHNFNFKIPKFVVFEIAKFINRKQDIFVNWMKHITK